MRNLEIKAKVQSLEAALKKATRIAGVCDSDVHQTDTYFNVPHGRLKLREYGDTAELISYTRPDTSEPKLSNYLIVRVSDPSGIKEALARALGIKCVVEKRRRIFLADRTRIHVDEVQGLGTFLEFEVVLNDDAAGEDPNLTVERLMREFRISEEDLVECSYSDLLEESNHG